MCIIYQDLEYNLPRKNIINGLKNINYGRKLISEDQTFGLDQYWA